MNLTNRQLLALLLLVQAFYLPINRPWGTPHSVALTADNWVPFQPIFVVPYILYFPFYLLTLVYFFREKKHFRPVAFAFLWTWLCSYIVFLSFQTQVIRPLISSKGFFEKAVQGIYHLDPPYNCFPSLHASNAMIGMLAFVYFAPRYSYIAIACGTLIAISTVLIKQHYILDVVGGVALASTICYRIFGGLPNSRKDARYN